MNVDDYWLGLDILPVARKSPTVWYDGNRSPYRYWGYGETNNKNTRCIVYRKNGFNDRKCTNRHLYTCKKTAGRIQVSVMY